MENQKLETFKIVVWESGYQLLPGFLNKALPLLVEEVQGERITLEHGGKDFFLSEEDGIFTVYSLRLGARLCWAESREEALNKAEIMLQYNNYTPGMLLPEKEALIELKGIQLPLNC